MDLFEALRGAFNCADPGAVEFPKEIPPEMEHDGDTMPEVESSGKLPDRLRPVFALQVRLVLDGGRRNARSVGSLMTDLMGTEFGWPPQDGRRAWWIEPDWNVKMMDLAGGPRVGVLVIQRADGPDTE